MVNRRIHPRKACVALITLFLLLQFNAGCALHYSPTVISRFDPIDEFQTHAEVGLINGQPSTADYKFYFTAPYYNHVTNLHDCTDVAIQTAERELTKRGAQINKNAGKTLTLEITDLNISAPGGGRIFSTATLQVQTSSGLSRFYKGQDFGFNIQNQLDGMISRSVVQMLNDPKIVEFLND